jgi:bifunctional DNA-binding transcriptional regulator/antitoxin component of YhaV-PrlF toxin-antitoxin module
MSPRSVLVLALVTLLTSVAAVVMVLLEPQTGRVVVDGEPAFPALRANPDAVAEIEVRGGGNDIVLERTDGEAWVSRTRDGYPVEPGLTRAIVVALSDMQLVEAKTSDPARFARLEVEDPDQDAASQLVTLRGEDGEVLAEVIVGKERNRLTGTEPAGTYIRRPEEEQSWLATGRVALPEEPDVWLEREVVDLAAEEVVEVEVSPADGPAYILRRAEDTDGWVLAGPEGEQPLADDADPIELVGALAGLRHQGIARADELAWPEPGHRLRFTTDGGLRVSVRAADVDGGPWITIEAAPALAEADPEALERAQAISGRTEGWAYALPRSAFDRLTLPLETWLGDGTS